MLTHTAGIPNFTEFPDYRASEATPTTPNSSWLGSEINRSSFNPAKTGATVIQNSLLLGYLIEKITGQRYQDFVEQNIFKPLGMQNSGYDSNTAIIPHRAAGYSPGPNGPVNAGYVDMSVSFSAGALYSTTHDLLRWEQGLFAGKLLSAESFKKMTTPFKRNYACGLVVHTINGHKVIDHGGGINGFSTLLAYYPDDKLTIIALGNIESGASAEIASSLAPIAGVKIVTPLPLRLFAY